MNFVTQKPSKFAMFIFFIVFLAMGNTVHGQTAESKEYAIKAAFLYNFARFVAWPGEDSQQSDPFVVCILGENPFGSSLANLESKAVRGRKFTVRYAKNAQDIGNCQMVYVSKSKKDEIEAADKTCKVEKG